MSLATPKIIASIDSALRRLHGVAVAGRPPPSAEAAVLSATEKDLVRGLMRVNHAGEVCAQALYLGQSLLARDAELRAFLRQAAAEEQDHMFWCLGRLQVLGDGPSRLSCVWFGGSMLIGMLVALGGDKLSLGFLSETERQVVAHLQRHLDRLPQKDAESRAILRQMLQEEAGHMESADRRGAVALPEPVQALMQVASKLMTTVAFRI